MYYCVIVRSGSLMREARLRAGLTQAELAARLGKAQTEVARWERGAALPSLERLREIIRACGLELTVALARYDDSNATIIDEHLRMTPQQRLADLIDRVRFQEMREKLTSPSA
jgi:transcriptional regulator with XRE-family HTH domain